MCASITVSFLLLSRKKNVLCSALLSNAIVAGACANYCFFCLVGCVWNTFTQHIYDLFREESKARYRLRLTFACSLARSHARTLLFTNIQSKALSLTLTSSIQIRRHVYCCWHTWSPHITQIHRHRHTSTSHWRKQCAQTRRNFIEKHWNKKKFNKVGEIAVVSPANFFLFCFQFDLIYFFHQSPSTFPDQNDKTRFLWKWIKKHTQYDHNEGTREKKRQSNLIEADLITFFLEMSKKSNK